MKNLGELLASDNKLAELPACIAVMPKLTKLFIAGNKLRDIPRFDGSYPASKYLSIDVENFTNECLKWLTDKNYYY